MAELINLAQGLHNFVLPSISSQNLWKMNKTQPSCDDKCFFMVQDESDKALKNVVYVKNKRK